MPKLSLQRERKQAIFSVALTVLWMPLLVVFFQGRQSVLLVFTLAFMAGYIVERIRLHRSIADLFHEAAGR